MHAFAGMTVLYDKAIIQFLKACFEVAGDDAAFIAAALGEVARVRGMASIA